MINKKFYKQKIETISLADLKQLINCNIDGTVTNSNITISGVSNISTASESELCFLTNKKYISNLTTTKSKICLIEKAFITEAIKKHSNMIFLVSNNAYNDLSIILEHFYIENYHDAAISKLSNIADSATIGKNTLISPGVVIGNNTIIGENCKIMPNSYIGDGVIIGNNSTIGANSVITYAEIGNNVEIMHNVSIGQDGYGFSFDGKNHKNVIQLGLVLIGDSVSIGSGTAIDRGSMENTKIGSGTKIDNLVHIAHNVSIGINCLITGQVGFAGSTEIGDFVVFGGQSGVAGHLKVGSYNRFAAQSGITKNIADNKGDFYGMPAIPKKEWQKEKIILRKLTKKM